MQRNSVHNITLTQCNIMPSRCNIVTKYSSCRCNNFVTDGVPYDHDRERPWNNLKQTKESVTSADCSSLMTSYTTPLQNVYHASN